MGRSARRGDTTSVGHQARTPCPCWRHRRLQASLFGPLRRTWGSIVTAASAASGTPVDKPGTSARRAHRGEDGEQSDADADADTGRERVGGGGSGGGGGQGGSGGVRDDEGLKRGAPGVEPVPA